MDWKRIKTILIVILAVTDAVLLINLGMFMPVDLSRNHNEIVKLYEVKGIRIEAEPSVYPEYVSGVVAELSPISATTEDRIQSYFENRNMEFNLAAMESSLLFLWTGIEKGPLLPIERPVDANRYLERCEAFFSYIDMGFVPKFIDFYSIGEVVAARVYQGIRIGNLEIPEIESELYVYFQSDDIVGVRIDKHLRLRTELGGRYGIISVDDALYKALGYAEIGDTMTGIRVVFKLNDNSLLATDLVRGEMFPYYELRFLNSEPIFVRATR